jgi:hypothetical protein
MIGFGAQTQVYLVAGATDMRKQIDGLAALVVDVLAADPFSSHLFESKWARTTNTPDFSNVRPDRILCSFTRQLVAGRHPTALAGPCQLRDCCRSAVACSALCSASSAETRGSRGRYRTSFLLLWCCRRRMSR